MTATIHAASTPKITAIAPWFGSNRRLATNVGAALKGCRWVGVPFGGGMCELIYFDAPTIVVADSHRWIINLAQIVADPLTRKLLAARLESKLFHPDELDAAQERMKTRDQKGSVGGIDAAADYFVCVWMGRSSIAGTKNEYHGRLSMRWNANGGDSNTRYRSAVAALDQWGEIARRCSFSVLDVFDFLGRVEDAPNCGLYCDPPFPGAGLVYRYAPDRDGERRWHERLATKLQSFQTCRIVCRFYDHPLIRELYPEPAWTWHHVEGRKQTNATAPEVLLVNKPSSGTFG